MAVNDTSITPSSAQAAPQLLLPDDGSRQREYVKLRRGATFILFVMAATYFVTRYFEPMYPSLAWLRVFSEAAMVGGLADWFAVTALFRHPMGIPIPHTAIVPNRKAQLAKVIGDFFHSNFFSGPVFREKVADFHVADKLLLWLADRRRAERVTAMLWNTWKDSSGSFDDGVLRKWFADFLCDVTRAVPLAPTAGRLLKATISASDSYPLAEDMFNGVRSGLQKHQEFLRELVGKELPWYLPPFVQRSIYAKLLVRIDDVLREMTEDPKHELRVKIIEELGQLAERLETSDELFNRGELLKKTLMSNEAFAGLIAEIWKELRSPGALPGAQEFPKRLAEVISLCAQRGLENETLRARLGSAVDGLVIRLAERYGKEVGGFIEETVTRWDSDTIVEKLETNVGRDLQYIRLNGTFVGGLVGVIIYAVGLAINARLWELPFR